MYGKRDKYNLPQKITSRERVLQGPQNAQNRLQLGMGGGGGWRSHVPVYMSQDFWTIGPLAHGSKIPK